MFLVKDELLHERHVADLFVDGLNSLYVDLLFALFRAETASHFGFSLFFSLFFGITILFCILIRC